MDGLEFVDRLRESATLKDISVVMLTSQKSMNTTREAMKKGGLEDQGAAQLLMGIAYYSQQKPAQAARWFKRAKKNPKTRDDATNWLNYLEREQRSG